MGGRGGRSPPLMIGALVACILVLGFNYWVSSSRNLELQTKMYELEGQVRRGAAERGLAEAKKSEFQEQIQRQKEQISHVESLYKRQLEASQSSCGLEKATLQQNVSSCAKTVQELKGQLNQLNDDLGKLRKDLHGCQGNVNTLNNKLTYDMTQCHSQVLSQKELCEERVAAAKLEVQKKMDKLIVPPPVVSSQNPAGGAGTESGPVATGAAAATAADGHAPSLSQPKDEELLTNEIVVDRDPAVPVEPPLGKNAAPGESRSVPSVAATKQESQLAPEGAAKMPAAETLTNNLTEEMEVMDVQEEDARTEEEDPGMEGMLIGQGKVDETPAGTKLEEPDEYDADEQMVGGSDLEKQQQSQRAENIDKDMEEELADYNGDDENEGEFEADKQAELAQN